MSIILAIDYGEVKSGIAVSDDSQVFAFGLTTIKTNSVMDYIDKYNSNNNISEFVIGQPKRMNDEFSDIEELIKKFINKLTLKFPNIPIKRFDERFTSKIALQTMIDAGLNKKNRSDKYIIDKISATIILQGYLKSIEK
ncbi:MAG: Holliday junction resolvase RuvX [Flavobacteriaceae bacterium]|nr:Holliday junction resolvase RuvX [Flavobacteriaceae bacterium]|tara:strand:- start:1557 stop:1973 length:417 start_codon:yes stop_codon:yes gene_type:complete